MKAEGLQSQTTKNQRIFITDCEGPISKNDNAFELSAHFIPKGDKFFALISRYDDVLADVVKKPGYKAGDTLRLTLPFLKAYEATNEKIKEYSSRNILLVPGAGETLRFVKDTMPAFIVSTSYEPYISSLCNLTGFPYRNVYCTRLNMDEYEIDKNEIDRIKELNEEISAMPMIEIPEDARSVCDFSRRDQITLGRLDEIFWKEIPKMESGRMLEEVSPVGGYDKANAVKDVIGRLNNRLRNVMYVGDSITDVSPFQLVRRNGGLTVSFNGNRYAIREADIAVLSHNTIVTSIIADVFNKYGRDRVIEMVKEWDNSTLEKYADPAFRKRVIESWPAKPPRIEIITDENRERLSKESSAFRKTVRGEAIGRLG